MRFSDEEVKILDNKTTGFCDINNNSDLAYLIEHPIHPVVCYESNCITATYNLQKTIYVNYDIDHLQR